MERGQFQIKHYAGDVVYSVDGFVDKNNDLLFRDIKSTMAASTNPIVVDCFPLSELESMKRPVTAGTQFKTSLNALIDILMAKTPSSVTRHCREHGCSPRLDVPRMLLPRLHSWAGKNDPVWLGLAGEGWNGRGRERRKERGWEGKGCVGLGWAGLGWAGLGWAGLGWLLYGAHVTSMCTQTTVMHTSSLHWHLPRPAVQGFRSCRM